MGRPRTERRLIKPKLGWVGERRGKIGLLYYNEVMTQKSCQQCNLDLIAAVSTIKGSFTKQVMKKLLLVSLMAMSSFVSALGQSDRKVEKNIFPVPLSVAIVMPDYDNNISVLSCKRDTVGFFMGRKRMVFVSDIVSLDLRAEKRNVGQYKSWITIDKQTEEHYLVSSFNVNGKPSVMIQPITHDGHQLMGSFFVFSMAEELCEEQ